MKFSDDDVRFGSETLLVSAKIEVAGKLLDFSISRSLENKDKTAALLHELNDKLNDLRKVEGGNKRDREKEQANIQRDIRALKKTLFSWSKYSTSTQSCHGPFPRYEGWAL
jgi:hypothetical protein